MYENTRQKKLTAGPVLQLLLNYWQENLFLRIQEFCLWNIFFLIVHNGVKGI
jgi:hypothetical protein